ncbi:MAG: NYN domain-containing protein [Clostridia bacterium]|nr:NYN domain-containing protein [Clostridia bacterium]
MTPVSVMPKAVAFVDFEHWYISLDRMHHKRPDYKAWYDEITSKYSVDEIYFFADFSNPSLRAEIPRIREITNFIIETQNSSPHHKKDYTDFIMLDHIYQRAMTDRQTDTYIIFSGDGHFSSVVNFLCVKLHKEVGIYAVRDAVSSTLRNAASWLFELPFVNKTQRIYYKLILSAMRDLEEANRVKRKKSRAAFWPTVDAVATANSLPKDEVADALRSLIENGYIYQSEERIHNKTIKVMKVVWDKIKRDRLIED